jgi:hypothetical protein
MRFHFANRSPLRAARRLAFGLSLCAALLPGTALAATVTIDTAVNNVSGNSTPPDYDVWPPASLGDPDNNTVVIGPGGTVAGDVDGADVIAEGAATATGNSVVVNGGMVNNYVYGAYAQSDTGAAAVTGNSAVVRGGAVGGEVNGGFADSHTDAATASGNSAVVSGGAVDGAVLGGFANSDFGAPRPRATASASAAAG